jgi:hypothetical protein
MNLAELQICKYNVIHKNLVDGFSRFQRFDFWSERNKDLGTRLCSCTNWASVVDAGW